ncbi:hypothetical protein VX159_10410 [Dechloromonas sp. ZY10]|uniref:hypothetical protein n=1 Tax=Dechloromonas aquae TaxID=2664436 RepID=UPI003527D904
MRLSRLPLLLAGLLAAHGAAARDAIDPTSCTLRGHKLYGKIQVVNAFPDLKVRVVTAFPQLKVKKVDAFPDRCGEWRYVDSFPDTKIQFVDAFPDLEIEFVTAFPGIK